MRLLVEVREDRDVHNQFGTVMKTEVVEIADLNAEGPAALLADLLRSMADGIDPHQSEPLADWERDLLRGERR